MTDARPGSVVDAVGLEAAKGGADRAAELARDMVTRETQDSAGPLGRYQMGEV